MCCLLTMTSKRKRNMTDKGLVYTSDAVLYDYQYYPVSNCTVVAMNATLDDFKAQPVLINNVPMQQFRERTVKDCRNIDGCIYMHLGKVSDNILVDLIEKFQKAKREVKDWKPKGRLLVRDNSIII